MATIEEVLARLSPEVRADVKLGSEIEGPVYATWEEEFEARMR